jgi:hypothetical protein
MFKTFGRHVKYATVQMYPTQDVEMFNEYYDNLEVVDDSMFRDTLVSNVESS